MLALLEMFFAAGCCASVGLLIILANKIRRVRVIARRNTLGMLIR